MGSVYASRVSSMGSSVPHAARAPVSRFNSMDSEVAPSASLPNTISMSTGNGNEELCPLCHNVKPAAKTTVTAIKSPDESVIETPDKH